MTYTHVFNIRLEKKSSALITLERESVLDMQPQQVIQACALLELPAQRVHNLHVR
jgi:hypothetical protein